MAEDIIINSENEKDDEKSIRKESNRRAHEYRSGWYGVILGILSVLFFFLLFIPSITLKSVSDATVIESATSLNMFQVFFGFTVNIVVKGVSVSETFIGYVWYSSFALILVLIGAALYCFMDKSFIAGIIGIGCDVTASLLILLGLRTIFSISQTSSNQGAYFADVTSVIDPGFYVISIIPIVIAILALILMIVMVVRSRKASYADALHGKKLNNY